MTATATADRRARKKRSALQRASAAASKTPRQKVSAETIDRSDTVIEIPIAQLSDHPANPKERVKREAIRDLVALIKEFGQREVIRVRKLAERKYQVLSGHRRSAALRQLKRPARCEVVECSDAEALRDVLLGNAERKGLNPIERAELLERMIDEGIDRAEAGRMLGLESESGVKNTLRLLKLPESMRKLVADGTVPARAARYVVPFAEATVIVDEWAEALAEDSWALRDMIDNPSGFFSLDLDNDVRPVDGKTTYRPGYSFKPAKRKFELDDKTRASLQIVELPLGKDGAMIEVAQNTELFDSLNETHLVKKSAYASSTSQSKSGKPLTGKEAAAEERRKKAEAKKQLAKRSEIWARRFRRSCLARQTPAMHPVILTSLAWWLCQTRDREVWIEAALETLGITGNPRSFDLLGGMIAASDDTFVNGSDHLGALSNTASVPHGYTVVDRLWRVLVWNQATCWPCGSIAREMPERVTPIPPSDLASSVQWSGNDSDIDTMLKFADCSLSGHWAEIANEGESSLVAEYVRFHTNDQLDDLAKQWSVDVSHAKTKRAKVESIVAAHTEKKPLPVPDVLKPKKKRTTKKRRAR